MIEDEEEELVDEEASTALQRLELALDGDLRPLTPAVFIPPGVRLMLAGNGVERSIISEELDKTFGKPSFDDNILRIEREVDPIGMAIAIVQGASIPVYVPNGNEVKVKYVQVSTRERMKLLHKLADRVLPAASPRKIGKPNDQPDAATDPVGFIAMVQRGAEMARAIMGNAKVIEAQPVEPQYQEDSAASDDAEADNPPAGGQGANS